MRIKKNIDYIDNLGVSRDTVLQHRLNIAHMQQCWQDLYWIKLVTLCNWSDLFLTKALIYKLCMILGLLWFEFYIFIMIWILHIFIFCNFDFYLFDIFKYFLFFVWFS